MTRALILPATGSELEAGTIELPAPGPEDVIVAVRAAGICHSDEHYRAGRSAAIRTPHVLGHEVAGEIVAVGAKVAGARLGERVCVHYVVSCGSCAACRLGREQFCESYEMIGMHRQGGYAERIVVPSVNAITLPAEVPYELGAILMCAGATALHALRRGRLVAGESVAVVGAGGIGMFAVRIARIVGASTVVAIDNDPGKLAAAAEAGAIAIPADDSDVAHRVREATGGAGVDLALDCVAFPATTRQALRILAVQGRAVVVGVATERVELEAYRDLLSRENELIGSNDHLRDEVELLLDLASTGSLAVDEAGIRRVPLDAAAVNGALADLRGYRAPTRTVIVP